MKEQSIKFLEDSDAQGVFKSAQSLRTIIDHNQLNKYCCMYLLGGHGCLEDFPGEQIYYTILNHILSYLRVFLCSNSFIFSLFAPFLSYLLFYDFF